MTYEQLLVVLQTTGIPFAYHHWEHPPAAPYGVYYFDSTENFAADDIPYLVIEHGYIELYTPGLNRELTNKLESALTGASIFWERDTEYIDDLRLYQNSYEIEV